MSAAAQDPMEAADPTERRRCSAHARSGNQCSQTAEPGATVCRFHGGAAPQVRRRAQLRLAALVDPAMALLAREMTNQTTGTPMSRLRAAENVLDRAGYPRRVEGDGGMARDLLATRLRELAEARMAEAEPESDHLTIEGTAVPDALEA